MAKANLPRNWGGWGGRGGERERARERVRERERESERESVIGERGREIRARDVLFSLSCPVGPDKGTADRDVCVKCNVSHNEQTIATRLLDPQHQGSRAHQLLA